MEAVTHTLRTHIKQRSAENISTLVPRININVACDNDKSRFGNYLTKNKLLGTNVNLHVVVLDRRSHDLRTN